MASLCRQILRGNAFRGVIMSTARRGYADKSANLPKLYAKELQELLNVMPDPLEHATGLERKELLALQSGNDDPFNMKVLKKAAGTRNDPTLVPSCFDARIVGCICEEHATSVTWLWVHKGKVIEAFPIIDKFDVTMYDRATPVVVIAVIGTN